jgi:hypothetical protein
MRSGSILAHLTLNSVSVIFALNKDISSPLISMIKKFCKELQTKKKKIRHKALIIFMGSFVKLEQ